MEDALGDEGVDRRAPLERGVQLEERFRPEEAVLQVAVDSRADRLVADREEALDVGAVITDELVAESEDIHEDQYLLSACGVVREVVAGALGKRLGEARGKLKTCSQLSSKAQDRAGPPFRATRDRCMSASRTASEIITCHRASRTGET